MGPLAGIRVIDLSRLAPGPYGSMLLGDLGAEVVRIDVPGTVNREGSILARNKRSIVLNLKLAAAQAVLHRLCETADVVLESNRPGVAKRLGADYETLSRLNPRLIYCSLTGYGQDGPMAQDAGHDINYISLAGVLSQIGTGSGPPIAPLNLVADFGGGGLLAAFGIVCAVVERYRSGKGQYIDAAMIDGAASLMAMHYGTQGAYSAAGRGMLGGGAPFYRCYECEDGRSVAVGAIEAKFFAALCDGLGVGEVDQFDFAAWPHQSQLFADRFREKTRDEWVEIFHDCDACVTPVLDLDEAPRHPHNVARELFHTDSAGDLQLRPVPRFSRTPGAIRSGEVAAGASSDEILAAAGFSGDEIAELRAGGAVE